MSDGAEPVNEAVEGVKSLLDALAEREDLVKKKESISSQIKALFAMRDEIEKGIKENEQVLAGKAGVITNLSQAMKFVVPVKRRAPAQPKWAHPTDPNKTWCGRGKKPGWAEGVELVAL